MTSYLWILQARFAHSCVESIPSDLVVGTQPITMKRSSDAAEATAGEVKKVKLKKSDLKKGTYGDKCWKKDNRSETKYVYDGTVLGSDKNCHIRDQYTEPIPEKNDKGALVFKDYPDMQPNMTPKEVLQAGSFGGTYFRPIESGVTGLKYNKMWEELPQNWLEGLDAKKKLYASTYNPAVNTYKVKCGGDLAMWEGSNWIKECDPYGWFMWYCRFYLGRRCDDDDRQISRWKNCTGPKGRWKNNLIGKIVKAGCAYDNVAVSPVIRQTLQHWAYKLNERDFLKRKKELK